MGETKIIFVDGDATRRTEIEKRCAAGNIKIQVARNAGDYLQLVSDAGFKPGCVVFYHASNLKLHYEERNSFDSFFRQVDATGVPWVYHSGGGTDLEEETIGYLWLIENLSAVVREVEERHPKSSKEFVSILRKLVGHAPQLLAKLQALDILIQGYLAIRDKEFLSDAFKTRYKLLAGAVHRAKALDATRSERLASLKGIQHSQGSYWFDVCLRDLDHVFTPTMDADVKWVEQASGLQNPALGRILDSGRAASADGALRRIVAILKDGTDGIMANPDWAAGFLSPNASEENLIRLFRAAHAEFVQAGKLIEVYVK